MSVTFEHTCDYYLAHVTGSLDSQSSEEFRSCLQPIVEQRNSDLILDLSETEYINSEGLDRIIQLHLAAKKNLRRLILISPVSFVRQVLSITKLDTLLTITDARADAIAALTKP